MIKEQEKMLANKERELERKRAFLEQLAEAQRMRKSVELNEEEIVLREKELQKKKKAQYNEGKRKRIRNV